MIMTGHDAAGIAAQLVQSSTPRQGWIYFVFVKSGESVQIATLVR